MKKPPLRNNLLLLLIFLLLLIYGCGTSEEQHSYGVFIGLDDPEDLEKIQGYNTVVIDGAFFTEKEIRKLREQGNGVIYSYLNIGSLENFRPFYDDFDHITLGPYESWPEEQWVDVSQEIWQDHIAQQAEELSEKDIDGFFLDNAGVYYYYHKPEIYIGLLNIIERLNKIKKPLIINGGDVFVTEGLKSGDLKGRISGVNQETVFTAIDFENATFYEQAKDEQEYFMEYLALCKDYGLDVFLLEYSNDGAPEKEIRRYCEKNGFAYYLSDSLELNTP